MVLLSKPVFDFILLNCAASEQVKKIEIQQRKKNIFIEKKSGRKLKKTEDVAAVKHKISFVTEVLQNHFAEVGSAMERLRLLVKQTSRQLLHE